MLAGGMSLDLHWSYKQALPSTHVPSCILINVRWQDPDHAISEKEGEAVAQQLFGLAAQYILLAHALQPGKDVYKKSLRVIKPLLPLPYLRSGPLTAMRPQDANLCREE